jgi:hypothetical protein
MREASFTRLFSLLKLPGPEEFALSDTRIILSEFKVSFNPS